MARKEAKGPRTCRACGSPMIIDETIIEGRGDQRIKRTFWHCVNGQCGHIDRIGDFPYEVTSTNGAPQAR